MQHRNINTCSHVLTRICLNSEAPFYRLFAEIFLHHHSDQHTKHEPWRWWITLWCGSFVGERVSHKHTLSTMIKHLTFYSKYNCLRATTHNAIGQKSRLFGIENSTSSSIIFDRTDSQRKQIAFGLRVYFWLLFRNRDREKERDRMRWRKTFKENCFVDLQAINNRYFDFV